MIADKLGMTETYAIEPVIACGAAFTCRNGRNTKYALITAAK